MDRTTRYRRAAIGTALVGAIALGAAPAANADHRLGPCDIHLATDETIERHSKELIRCAVAKWAVKGGAARAICIAKRESGLIPTAESSDGRFLGLFQHMRSAWPDRYDAWTRPGWELKTSALNGRTNAVVTIRMVHAGGWGAWGALDC